MGCFEQLVVPWRASRDLEGDGAAAHLEENFREIDRWANPLNLDDDCQGGCSPNARGFAYAFEGTLGAGDVVSFGPDLGVGGSSLEDELALDDATGIWTVPRNGLYIVSVHVEVNVDALPQPYFFALNAGGVDTKSAPTATGATWIGFASTQQLILGPDFIPIFITGLSNAITATDDLPYRNGIITVSESPCSDLPPLPPPT